MLIGAFVAGMICAVGTGYLADNSRVKSDTVMGVVFSGMFGLGIVMFTWFEVTADLNHILFGNMLGIGPHDLRQSGIIALVVSAFICFKSKDLLLHAFDPAQAKASGLPVGMLHYGLLVGLSLTVVATLSATGLILAVALLITPGAIAYLLMRSFGAMMLVAVLVCFTGMLSGIYLSFFWDSAPAATIVLLLTIIFLLAFGYRLRRNRKAAQKVDAHA